MAGRGAPPKATLTRPNDQARRDAQVTKVASDGAVRGPELPDGDWHPRTVAWWQTWRTSPMSQTFTDTDWDTLLDTALLHTQMWNGNMSVAAELRLRTAKWGATVEDRMRLKLQVESEAAQAKEAAPIMATDRRQRLLRAVNGSA